MFIPQSELKKILIDSGVISAETFQRAAEEAARTDKSVLEILISNGEILESYYTELLSQYFNLPVVDLKAELLPIETLEILPESLAKTRKAIVFRKSDTAVHLALLDPNDLEIIEYVKKKTNLPVIIYLTSFSDYRYAIKRYKRVLGQEFKEFIEKNIAYALRLGKNIERAVYELPIISILDTITEYAIAQGASDIHFEPFETKTIVRFRLEGELKDILELPQTIHPILVARIKILANLPIDIHNAPLDGRYKFRSEDVTMAVRVSVMPTLYGEKVVLRILPTSARPMSFLELGLSPKNVEVLEKEISKPYGLILVTGPTGCGKTTTLYSILNVLNKPEVNIVTIEDPIEYDIPRVNQTQINPKVGLTFAEGIRSFLRQNPDIIMVGEIRDRETAGMAVHAAMTGHLVFSTLHTNDAATAIIRLLDMKVENFLLASTLRAVIAQRLVKRICPHCIRSVPVPPELNKIVEEQLKKDHGSLTFNFKNQYEGAGCEFCGLTGYKGQVAIFEILVVTHEMRELILREVTAESIKQLAISQGMTTMLEDGLLKVQQGITTIEEVLRAISE